MAFCKFHKSDGVFERIFKFYKSSLAYILFCKYKGQQVCKINDNAESVSICFSSKVQTVSN